MKTLMATLATGFVLVYFSELLFWARLRPDDSLPSWLSTWIAYSLVAQAFPPALSGRANTALNLLVFAGAFGLQWGIGIFVDALQGSGWSGDAAFRAAFYPLSGGQFLAILWLLRPVRQG